MRLSAKQKDALTVLLTGRGERNFSDLIKRMVASKNLEFDMVCLKPEAGPKNQRFGSTMQYKQALLHDLVHTYNLAEEIKVYEDRPKQCARSSNPKLPPHAESISGQKASETFSKTSIRLYFLTPAAKL